MIATKPEASAPAEPAEVGTPVEDKPYNVRFKTDEDQSHLIVMDSQLCARCTDKPCTFFCPVTVYKWESADQKISVGYEKCVECGACRIGCPVQHRLALSPRRLRHAVQERVGPRQRPGKSPFPVRGRGFSLLGAPARRASRRGSRRSSGWPSRRRRGR